MRTIYLDEAYRCHLSDDGTMRPVETDVFDGKCRAYVEGYCYVPEGETFARNGKMLVGKVVFPYSEYDVLEAAQAETLILAQAGAAQVQARMTETGSAPEATTGIFVRGVKEWETGKTYAKNDLFSYRGAMGYVRQDHTAQEAWLPFAVGTEALYGARPAPDAEGIYPYVYGMAADVGMRVSDSSGAVYVCTQAIEGVFYAPDALPAHFEEVTCAGTREE